jgi:hypothetical protein
VRVRRLQSLAAAVVLTSTVASASPEQFKEQLSKDEIAAAELAARKRLPPVDKAAAEKCRARPMPSAEELAAFATCARAAGSLGGAIKAWEEIVYKHRGHAVETEALRNLGPAYEAAGRFSDAAKWHVTYVHRYGPGELNAARSRAPQLIRAICIWRQLGMSKEAEREFQMLRTYPKYRTVDSATLCDSVRPIAVPAQR